MDSPIDSHLVLKLKHSDKAAFKQIFEVYYPSVFKNIYFKTKDYEAARDLAQETFVKCWDNREKIDVDKSFYYWLVTIASNLTTNYFKKQQMIHRHNGNLKLDDSAYADSADELLEAEQLKEKIDAIVAKYLPKKCQTIFIMSRFEGKSNDEISAELSISKKTVENQIYEALKTIRKKMKKTMGVASYTIVLF